jgi:hypothetical protein
MSMRALANRTALNKEVQNNNRLSIFTTPIIQSGDVNVSHNLNVSGNTTLNTLDISGDLTVRNDIICYGTIYAVRYISGQVISTYMLNYTDISQNTIDISNTIANGNNTRTIFDYEYLAKSDNSQILIEYQTDYFVNSVNNSNIQAYLYVKNNISDPDIRNAETHQNWTNSVMQTNTIFPIVGRHTNTIGGIIYIRVDVYNSSNNILTVYGNKSTWLKITEIGL